MKEGSQCIIHILHSLHFFSLYNSVKARGQTVYYMAKGVYLSPKKHKQTYHASFVTIDNRFIFSQGFTKGRDIRRIQWQ